MHLRASGILFTLLIFISCSDDSPVNHERMGILGEPFEANQGDIVQFDEINTELIFQHFDDYFHGTISPNTTVRILIQDANSSTTVELYAFESDVLRGFSEKLDPDSTDNFFIHYVPIGDLTLEMTKLIWNDNSANPRSVELAEFVLR